MYKIVTRVLGIPDMRQLPKERASDLVEDPVFTKIRREVRERAASSLANHDPVLIESAQYASPVAFERYTIPEDVVTRLGNAFGLRFPQARMQCQQPGGMATMHVDDLRIGYMEPHEPTLPRFPFTEADRAEFEKDPYYAVRFLIFLEPSLPGQGALFHDTPLVKWQAGDAVYWDWVNTAHATFNTSFWPRYLIRLTGLRTEKTIEILNGQHPIVSY